ncbi:Pre-mRNA-splicing factor 38 [Corchorus olitorius]|uniref:Pre-mRNA-splicing factor 38 n=1 Tax=Corchorus olitorius TaxID=93759 RepID=A0A1R3KK07_9ROSI|nr:Pre-mRNA-splicing factor 38 [Corchorus olitorius]
MANRTDPAAKSIRGTNPQNLVEKILRSKIYQSKYWKEQCFGLTAETLVDKAMELKHIGGTYGGNRKPTPFMCLVMKMLQIQPEKDIVVEFIKNDDYKYVRVLGAFYLRLTGIDTDIYRYLEPLYNDYRKVRRRSPDGKYSLTHVDEIIDELLTTDYSCDIALPRIKKSHGWAENASNREVLVVLPGFSALTVCSEKDHERRDRDRGRRRSRSRSRSRSRDRKRHARSSLSPRRHEPEDGSAREETKKMKEKKEKKDDGTDHPDPEIAEANRIRASLGLKPLKL